MVRHKRYDYGQPVRFQQQILPGAFEYTLNKLIDEHFDLSVSNRQGPCLRRLALARSLMIDGLIDRPQ
jgi:hypothetical protein